MAKVSTSFAFIGLVYPSPISCRERSFCCTQEEEATLGTELIGMSSSEFRNLWLVRERDFLFYFLHIGLFVSEHANHCT